MHTWLAAENIEVRYRPDALPALRGFTLGLRPGVFVGVIGPNGSGKSTLVRALSRTLRPACGAVLLGADDLYKTVSARRAGQAVGVVPQGTSVALDFSVREVVRMGRAPHLPRRASRPGMRPSSPTRSERRAWRTWPSGRSHRCRAGSASASSSPARWRSSLM